MKKFHKFSALALCGAMTLALAACGTADANTAAPSEAAQSSTYTATAQGFGGDVTVTLTVNGGEVEALTVEGAGETEAVGGAAIQTFNDTFAGYAGKDLSEVGAVDAVSGATITSDAVQTALDDVLTQAAG